MLAVTAVGCWSCKRSELSESCSSPGSCAPLYRRSTFQRRERGNASSQVADSAASRQPHVFGSDVWVPTYEFTAAGFTAAGFTAARERQARNFADQGWPLLWAPAAVRRSQRRSTPIAETTSPFHQRAGTTEAAYTAITRRVRGRGSDRRPL